LSSSPMRRQIHLAWHWSLALIELSGSVSIAAKQRMPAR